MNAKLIELAERRTTLVARAATQRAELSQALAPWREALAVVDRGLGGGALHQEPCCAAGGGSGLRGAASSLAHGEMAAAGLAGVAYGTCGEANPAWLVSSISRLPPGLGYKIFDILIGIAQEKRLERMLGIVLTESRRMLYICCKSAFKAEQLPEGLDRVELILR